MTSRWGFAGLVIASTAAASTSLFDILRVDGFSDAKWLYFSLVTILFLWIAAAFWLCISGAITLLWGADGMGLSPAQGCDPALKKSTAKVALLFPIRNEECSRLFAGVMAMIECLAERQVLDHFDVILLSDSHGREHLLAEQAAFLELRALWEHKIDIFYRHRTSNAGRKSGNLAQFCRTWGGRYDYMVVLDADSLMTADTLIELTRLMDSNPKTGLIQTAPQLVGRQSLFARMQQFASSVYGPLYSAGYSAIFAGEGNYWGHNAIIRVRAFADNCGLPLLSGRAPLGGEIMSHDFVEAALLRRAGWEVHMASHLEGSYEEPPPGLIEHLKRDRRWCQGNLQHMKLLFAQGLRPSSRWHLTTGIMSYLASPLWLLLLVASAVVALQQAPFVPYSFVGSHPVLSWPVSHTGALLTLFGTMLALLFVPKLVGMALALRSKRIRNAHGGAASIMVSVILESLFSALLAPIMMLSQTGFVASILMGRNSGWKSQTRSESNSTWDVLVVRFLPHTILGALATGLVLKFLPEYAWWLLPVLAGPVLAIPLAALTESVRAGQMTMRWGLFVAPWEAGTVPLVEKVHRLMRVAESSTGNST
ncbi:MAG: glucans biosynthesis glucosyltransferase MdoH [Rhizomicrobium sp.]